MGGLKEFHLNLYTWIDDQYDLPQVVFETLSVKYLNLCGCSLGKICKAPPYNKLNVETLCLSYAYIEDETLRMIISCCPLIEDLKLIECDPLCNIEVNKLHNLKKFSFSKYNSRRFGPADVRIEIEEVRYLQEVCIRSCTNWVHEHNFHNVKSLELTRVSLSSKSFDYFSSNFHSLEKLMIEGCFGFRRFRLQSRTLKHFAFTHEGHEPIFEATFDTPKMVHFKYFAEAIPSLYFKTISSECKSVLYLIPPCFRHNCDVTSWFLKLHEMLNVLSKSEISLDLALRYWYREWIMNPLIWNNLENIEIPHQVVVESLHLGTLLNSSPVVRLVPLLNAFSRIFCPKKIELYWNGGHFKTYISRVAEFLWKSIMERDNIQNQEIIKQQFFWQQDLEEVSVETFDERQGKWIHLTKWIPLQRKAPLLECKSSEEKQKLFRFQLKWRKAN